MAQAVDAADGGIDLLLAFARLLLAAVGRLRRLAAGTCDLVGSGDHFMEGGGDHVDCLTLAPGGLGHVAGHACRAGGGVEDIAGRGADVLDKAANGPQELVEPARQLGSFVTAADFQVAGQVPFALGDVLKPVGDAVDRAHDQFGEGGTHDGEHGSQYQRDDPDQPGQAGGGLHHLALLDQPDKRPAQLFVRVDVGHVANTVQLDFSQALAVLGKLGVAVAEARQLFEVVRGIPWVYQDVAVIFDQQQVPTFAQLDLLDDFGEAFDGNVDVDYAARVAQLVGHGTHGADQYGIVGGPVVGTGAQGLARVGHGQLIPRARTRIVVDELLPCRPADVAPVGDPVGEVGIGRMSIGQAGHERQNLARLLAQLVGRRGTRVLGQLVASGRHQGLRGHVLHVLADALEEDVHRVADLTDFSTAAVEEAVPGLAA